MIFVVYVLTNSKLPKNIVRRLSIRGVYMQEKYLYVRFWGLNAEGGLLEAWIILSML